MGNKAIELHDSTISFVQGTQEYLELIFDSAYIHESTGHPGYDDGTGWVQGVRLVLFNPVIKGKWPAFPSDIKTGTLSIGEHVHDNVVPLPLNSSEAIKLIITFLTMEN